MSARRLAVIAAAAALAGCGLTPEVGPPLVGECVDGALGSATVSFSNQIRPIIASPTDGCSCHLPTAAQPGPATVITGLDLSTYEGLRAGGHNSNADVVIDKMPCESILFQKISPAPPFGSRMPLGLAPLSQDEINLFHDWIAQGALDN